MNLRTTMLGIGIGLLTTAQLIAQQAEVGSRGDEPSYDTNILKIRSELQGVVKPAHQAVLRTPTSGNIRGVFVREGQVVEQGQPLLALDDQQAAAALQVARVEAERDAQLRVAEIALLRAKARLDRVRSAMKHDAASRFELEEKTSEYEAAMANRDLQLEQQQLAQARLAQAADAVEALTVKAPFSGLVLQINAEKGNSVDSTQPAVTIIDLDQLEVELHLPVAQFGTLAAGQVYSLKAFEPVNRLLPATAVFVSPVIEPTSGTFRCVFRLANEDHALPAGFQVRFAGQP